MDQNVEALLKELKNENFQTLVSPLSTTKINLTDDSLGEFILGQASELVMKGIQTIDYIRTNAIQSGDAKEVEALAQLVASVNGAIDTLGKIHIQNKKAKAAKELKQLDTEATLNQGSTVNVLVATREDIFKQFLDRNKQVIEAEFKDVNPDE